MVKTFDYVTNIANTGYTYNKDDVDKVNELMTELVTDYDVSTLRSMTKMVSSVCQSALSESLPDELIINSDKTSFGRVSGSAFANTTISLGHDIFLEIDVDALPNGEESILDICQSAMVDDHSDMVDMTLILAGQFNQQELKTDEGEKISRMTTPTYITMARDPELDMESVTCASLSGEGNLWNANDGCDIVDYTNTTVTFATYHFSYFTLQSYFKRVFEMPIKEPETDDSAECGMSYLPGIAIAVILDIGVTLMIAGYCLDRKHRDQRWDQVPLNKKNLVVQERWQTIFCQGHLTFGILKFHLKEFNRVKRAFCLLVTLMMETALSGLFYWASLSDKEDENSIIDAFYAWNLNDVLILVVSLAIMALLGIFVKAMMIKRTIVGIVLGIVLIIVACLFDVLLVFELCALAANRWLVTIVAIFFAEILVVQTLFAFVRLGSKLDEEEEEEEY